ncbi:MAG: DUF1328 domain-containing protein [Methylacidiphilales bacterium]|nr:DUF1328 domain-containing protein [Candidatus Methylacidiphilales bacterium]
MITWAVALLVIGLVAAVLGFSGLAGTATSFATTLFWVALVAAVVFFVINTMRGRSV